MEKNAVTDLELEKNILSRWSPRAFDPGSLLDESVFSRLLEAVRWAPSASNTQPWRFIAGLNFNDTHRRILDCLDPANRAWACRAPLLVVTLARKTGSRTGRPRPWAEHDAGVAAGFMLLQARDMGIFSHPMGGFSQEKVRKAFAVPEGIKPLSVIAFGRYGDPTLLSGELRDRENAPRERLAPEKLLLQAD